MESGHLPLDALRTHKTVVLTSYRRDGREVDTPVHLAVDGDRAFVRTYETAFKTKRLRRNPQAVLWRAANGTGPALPALLAPRKALRAGEGIHVHARELPADEAREAARALARKYPVLQGLVIPAMHRFVYRTNTIHFELTPEA